MELLRKHVTQPLIVNQMQLSITHTPIIAEKYGVTDTAIAVAWITRHPANIQVVLGTINPQRVADAAASSEIPLTRGIPPSPPRTLSPLVRYLALTYQRAQGSWDNESATHHTPSLRRVSRVSRVNHDSTASSQGRNSQPSRSLRHI